MGLESMRTTYEFVLLRRVHNFNNVFSWFCISVRLPLGHILHIFGGWLTMFGVLNISSDLTFLFLSRLDVIWFFPLSNLILLSMKKANMKNKWWKRFLAKLFIPWFTKDTMREGVLVKNSSGGFGNKLYLTSIALHLARVFTVKVPNS